MADAARLIGGLASPVFPLSLRLDLEGRNPNASEAGLNRLEWILFHRRLPDDFRGSRSPVTIPANSTLTIPVELSVDSSRCFQANLPVPCSISA